MVVILEIELVRNIISKILGRKPLLVDAQGAVNAVAAAPKKSWVVASNVNRRDGVGVELLVDNELVLEIFRDDTEKTREVTLRPPRDRPMAWFSFF